ncbi:MAG TPA: hypothetical protein VKB51_09905 [bacterium]|nr:hypothetical protein [bacterium]
MAVQTITSDQFPRGTSRYTVAMAKCLVSLRPGAELSPTRPIVQALINLVQGRMLEYLADRICREYDIQDPVLRQRIVTVLLGIFSDEFFALFRSTIEFQPNLVVQIARRIIRKEGNPEPAQKYPSPTRQPADRLYPALFRKYFEYRNLGTLLELVESDAQIQRIILRNVLDKHLSDAPIRKRILQILEEDRDDVAPSLFMGYLKGNDVSTLAEKVHSGAWEPEMADLREHMAHLRGD